MNTDALSNMVIVILLGDRDVTQEICSNWVEKEKDESSAHVDYVEPRSPAYKENPPDGLAHLVKAGIRAQDSGAYVLHVTGFPRFAEDARAIMDSCPNLLVFSLEPARDSNEGVRNVFSRSDRFVRVDARRNISSQKKFIRSRLREYIQSLRIRTASIPQVAEIPNLEPAFAK